MKSSFAASDVMLSLRISRRQDFRTRAFSDLIIHETESNVTSETEENRWWSLEEKRMSRWSGDVWWRIEWIVDTPSSNSVALQQRRRAGPSVAAEWGEGTKCQTTSQPADRQTDSSPGEPVTVCRSAAANQVTAVLGVVFASRDNIRERSYISFFPSSPRASKIYSVTFFVSPKS